MSRPLRIEYPSALLHVTSRGNERCKTFVDDIDRERFLDDVGHAVDEFRWIVTAYALMPTEYNLLIELREATLSTGVKWLNSKYAQAFNRRHERVGHLFHSPFKAVLIDKETYFRHVARSIVLNPVRAGLVSHADDYPWTSYRATAGKAPAPEWLAVDDLLRCFATDASLARACYRRFVNGRGRPASPWTDVVGQQYLGSESWLERVRDQIEMKPRCDAHPRLQRGIGRPRMAQVVVSVSRTLRVPEERIRHGFGGVPRKIAAWIAREEGWLSDREIAAGLGIRSSGRVAGLIGRFDRELAISEPLQVSVDRCLATLRRKMGKSKL